MTARAEWAIEDSFVGAGPLRLGEGELGRAARLVSLIFLLSAALVLLKSAQSGIFLMAYKKTMIPWAFFASAITLSVASLATVPLASRLGAARLLRVTLLACACALVGVWALLAAHAPAAPFVLYVIIEAASGVLLIHGWAVVSQATTARSAKRLLPIAGSGATLAWTFVGLLVVPLAHVFGAPALLLGASGMLVALVPLVTIIRHRDLAAHVGGKRRSGMVAEWGKALAYLRAVPLLRVMATLSILALVTEQFMDYVLMTAAHERYTSEAACAGFFGRYYGITSAITLTVLLTRLGTRHARAGHFPQPAPHPHHDRRRRRGRGDSTPRSARPSSCAASTASSNSRSGVPRASRRRRRYRPSSACSRERSSEACSRPRRTPSPRRCSRSCPT